MVAKNKQRISITVEKDFLEDSIKTAAAEWGLTISEYIISLIKEDLTVGITAQARRMVSGRDGG